MPHDDDLERSFALYFAEMDRCAKAGHSFALLHVIVALPDVCAALEDPNRKSRERYLEWCERYHRSELLSAVELYDFRCGLLHRGQALGRGQGRYDTYSFPVDPGISFHLIAVPSERNITLDPRRMAEDMRQAVEAWFADLRKPDHAPILHAVRSRLHLLMRVQVKTLPGIGGASFYVVSST